MGLGRSKLESYFLSDREGNENIYRYMDRKVQPDTQYLCMCGMTVDKVVQYLYCNLADKLKDSLYWKLSSAQLKQMNVKEILKSGSLGKSTAVKEKSDIDLIIFLNGISGVEHLSQLLPTILSTLGNVMGQLARDRSERWISGLEVKRTTKFSLGLMLHTINDDGSTFDCEMDLLPAIDITATRDLLDIYAEMELTNEDLRRYYSACLSRIQKDFVSLYTRPAKVKNLIRFMKFWAKVEEVPLRSYCIELLVIYNNRKHGRQQFMPDYHDSQDYEDFHIYDHLKECLHILTNCETLTITFSDHYNYRDYGKPPLSLSGILGSLMGFSSPNTNVQVVPYLLDPANPYMNTAPSPNKSQIVSQKAKELLDNWDRIFP